MIEGNVYKVKKLDCSHCRHNFSCWEGEYEWEEGVRCKGFKLKYEYKSKIDKKKVQGVKNEYGL